MPEVDLETLASSASDQKFTHETTVNGGATKNVIIPVDRDADFPPESFWLSKDAEHDWFDRNAVYERKESTKGNSSNSNPMISNSNSQRSGAKSRASMIGLPKTQKNTFLNSKWRPCKPVNARLFPKRQKSAVPELEPGSPKVSCIGRVRSKRGRRRSNSSTRKEKPTERLAAGFCSKLLSAFRLRKGLRKPLRSGSGKVVEAPEEEEPRRKSAGLKARENPVGGDPPGLGGMTRFVSGRRSCEWAEEEISRAI